VNKTGTHKRRATSLKSGESSVILEFANEEMSSKFLEIGCLPKSSIRLIRKGPGGKTMYFHVNGHAFALREEEASHIILKY
jgi:Fe2+ transport system protein FeoA